MIKQKNIILIILSALLFTGCMSFEESELYGKHSITSGMTDLRYYYTVAGSLMQEYDDDRIVNLTQDQRSEFSNVFSPLLTAMNYQDNDVFKENLGTAIGFKNTFLQARDVPSKAILRTFRMYTLSGFGNLTYNATYIVNLPSKVLHTIHFETKYTDTNIVWSIIKNIIYGLWGLLQALIMLVLGTIVGFLCHPINSFTDIYHLFIPFVESLWLGIKFIFVGYI